MRGEGGDTDGIISPAEAGNSAKGMEWRKGLGIGRELRGGGGGGEGEKNRHERKKCF